MRIVVQYNKFEYKNPDAFEDRLRSLLVSEYPAVEIDVYHDAAPDILVEDEDGHLINDSDEGYEVKVRCGELRRAARKAQ